MIALVLLGFLIVFLQFSLSPDPSAWGADLSLSHAEPDDYLHNPDPKRDRINDKAGNIFTVRGLANLGCLALLSLGIITLLCVPLFDITQAINIYHIPALVIPSSHTSLPSLCQIWPVSILAV